MTMGQILREIRKEQKTTLYDAAASIGCSHNTLHMYEKDKKTPWRKLEQILDYYGYELEVVKKDG